MDPFAHALRVAGVWESLGTLMDAGGLWGVRIDGYPGAALHAVARGEAWLDLPDRPPTRLRAGDVMLVPTVTSHGLTSQPGSTMGPCDAAAAERARATGAVMRLGTEPRHTRLVTLHYKHDPAVSTPVLAALDKPMHVRAQDNHSLEGTVGLLIDELSHPQFATAAAVNGLVDLLLVQFVRAWLNDHHDEPAPSWLGAISDPIVRDALTAIHQRPSHTWTTATLADEIKVSRATLSRRFPAATGETPGAYLTRWRMDVAAVRLRETDLPVDVVAGDVGYTSAHAFSRAFRRSRGVTPSEFRASGRTA